MVKQNKKLQQHVEGERLFPHNEMYQLFNQFFVVTTFSRDETWNVKFGYNENESSFLLEILVKI